MSNGARAESVLKLINAIGGSPAPIPEVILVFSLVLCASKAFLTVTESLGMLLAT